MNNNNNTIGIIVVGLVAFLAIVVTGKWLLDKKHDRHDEVVRHEMVAPPVAPPVAPTAPAPNQPIIVVPPSPQIVYPYHVPEYHNSNQFWAGYNDGWNNLPSRRFTSPEYYRGYEIGQHDRRTGRHYYYDRYYPPGFNLSLPGFHLNIR